jgi:hypothetical protein
VTDHNLKQTWPETGTPAEPPYNKVTNQKIGDQKLKELTVEAAREVIEILDGGRVGAMVGVDLNAELHAAGVKRAALENEVAVLRLQVAQWENTARRWEKSIQDSVRVHESGMELVRAQSARIKELESALKQAAAEALRKAVVALQPLNASPIGPLHYAGWSDCFQALVKIKEEAERAAKS